MALRSRRWDDGIPPLLRPLVRAYLLGYASAVAPRLLTLLLQQHVSSRRTAHDTRHGEPFLAALRRILGGGLDWRRFPAFCALLVGGSTLLERPSRAIIDRLAKPLSDIARRRLARWCASFIAAWLSLRLLQSKQTPGFTATVATENGATGGAKPKTIRYAGRTLDLTLFAVTRALDVIGGELWHRRKLRRQAANKWTAAEAAISRLTDPAIFALSSGLIMWTWIYLPSRLPRAYNKWIASAAAVDPRLIEALQRCRSGELRYGEDTGQAPLLTSMCADYGWPPVWGNPAKSIPFPCEMVHMGCGPSCEYHAVSRFVRSFRWALATYLPLNLLLALRNRNRNRTAAQALASLRRAVLSASRSAAFLSTFIALFYYGVCLARTRAGPRLLLPLFLLPHSFGNGTATTPTTPTTTDSAAAAAATAVRQRIDAGACVASGCLLCGWSILLEQPARRKDMALFVAPRALATLLPRRYARAKQWRETLAFAASTAVVFTCVLERRERVRGVLGAVLGSVLRP